MRLDCFVADRFGVSRQKARDMILQQEILVNEKVQKPSYMIKKEDFVKLIEAKRFVSRAGDKLWLFLNKWNLSQKKVLDVGSSTGGFAQVLLDLGAEEVHCVDVGRDQLHQSLRENPRIRVFEQCDIREFNAPCFYDLLTCDLSFISIEKIFDALKRYSNEMILLFKPQFEVGRGIKRNKKGVVLDQLAILKALDQFEEFLCFEKFTILKKEKSCIKGRMGNVEYFFHIRS